MTNAPDKDFYKETVFLPKTDFPMRGELPKKEPDILKKWQDMDLYGQIEARMADHPPFILHDGPPYANGHIHLGHAMNKFLKDVVIRTQRGRGFRTPYTPGWDCHGLPIEWKIEEQYREKGQDKDKVDILQFRAECRAFAQKWVDVQRADFERLGVVGDWDAPYLTMTNKAESRIVMEIHKFLKNGLLYKGAKPVMWSVVEKTALAEAEVEYKEHKSITVWARFPVVSSPLAALQGAAVVIWTTTPWTLPSNRAVAFGDAIEYSAYTVTAVGADSKARVGETLILATALADDVKAQAKIEDWTASAPFKGKDIAGTICAHPLRGQGYEFDVPALSGDFVTDDAGTGFVHIAPGHGQDDFMLGMANGIEITDNVTDDGLFRPHVPLFAGKAVYTAKGEMGDGNFAVLKAFEDAGALLAKGSLRHEYPHSWRSKAPIIFRTTPQWFIAMDKPTADGATLRATALKAIGDTTWVPAQGENRIRAMVESRPDWCISRQRAWGVPIALFVNKDSGEILKDDAVLNRIATIFETEGSDSWWARPAQDFLGNDYKAADYDQVFDIVDVWFESGSTHAFVLDESQVPADLYLEGSDQHRGWFQSSLMESCGTRGHAPFKAVMTHGFILDDKGYKMSKSLGNIIAPQDLIAEYGADILRLWSVSSDYAADLRIGKDTLKNTSDIYRRFRNTLRFLLGALDGLTTEELVKAEDYAALPALEQYVLSRIAETDGFLRQQAETHAYNDMVKTLHNFCNSFLSSFYFDIRKDRLYCDRPDGFERRACRTVLYHLFDFIVTWLAPIMPYTAEEAWTHRPGGVYEDVPSVHLRTVPIVPGTWRKETLDKQWDDITKVRSVVLGALELKRADKTIGSSLEAAPHIFVTTDHEAALKGIDLAEVMITSGATLHVGAGADDAFRISSLPGIAVTFAVAEGKKCVRCWKVQADVGTHAGHPELCARCADATNHHLKTKKAA